MKDELYSHVVHLFMQTDRLHRSAVELNLTNLPIHRSQHLFLISLERCERPPKQADLAEMFGISAAAVTNMLKKLESAGYIERRGVEGDCRIKEIYLSEYGKAFLKESRELFDEVDRNMFEDIPEDDILTLKRILEKMQDNLRKASPEISDEPPKLGLILNEEKGEKRR